MRGHDTGDIAANMHYAQTGRWPDEMSPEQVEEARREALARRNPRRERLLAKVSEMCARPIKDFRDLTPIEVEALCRLIWPDEERSDR